MKVGAEPRKVAILGALLLVAGYLYYSNRLPEGPAEPSPPVSTPRPAASTPAPIPARTAARPRTEEGSVRAFRPSLKPRRPEDRPDPMSIDPTLRLDLLAKLQNVKLEAVQRSLFEFSQAPPPKTPEPKIVPKDVAKAKEAAKEAENKKAKADTKPPAPPINLKFYGYISPVQTGAKRAFFLDGDEIFVASEGDVIQKRYKVVRIGVNSAVVEDTEHKHQQTLALVAEQVSS
jgi:hypothetical protein